MLALLLAVSAVSCKPVKKSEPPVESTPITAANASSIMALYGLSNTEETVPVTNNTKRADPSSFLGEIRFLYARNGNCADDKNGNLIRDRRPEQLEDFEKTSNTNSQTWDSVVINQNAAANVTYLKALSLDFSNKYQYSMTRLSTAAHTVTPNAKWNAAIVKYKADHKVELWDDSHYCAIWYVKGVSVEQAVVKKLISVDVGGKGAYMVNVDGKAHYGTEQNSVKEIYLLDIVPAKLPQNVAEEEPKDRSKKSLTGYMDWINSSSAAIQ